MTDLSYWTGCSSKISFIKVMFSCVHISSWPHANSDFFEIRPFFLMHFECYFSCFDSQKTRYEFSKVVYFVQPVKKHMFATLPKCYDLINEFKPRPSVLVFRCGFFMFFFLSFLEQLTILIIILVRCLYFVRTEPKGWSYGLSLFV